MRKVGCVKKGAFFPSVIKASKQTIQKKQNKNKRNIEQKRKREMEEKRYSQAAA